MDVQEQINILRNDMDKRIETLEKTVAETGDKVNKTHDDVRELLFIVKGINNDGVSARVNNHEDRLTRIEKLETKLESYGKAINVAFLVAGAVIGYVIKIFFTK